MSNVSTGATTWVAGLLVAFAFALPTAAEDLRPAEEVMAELVTEAEAANLALAGAAAGVAQRLASLDQARARYLPAIDLSLRYSRADGGREIDFPVGDLLNPVYASLNSLLEASGQPAPFQPIDNVSVPFLRDREQESVVTLTQPLYDARLAAGARAAAGEYDAARFGLDALRVRVTRDVRQAYLRWLATQASVEILESSLGAAEENQRVNDSLYRNGRVTRDVVLRAEADVLEIEQQLAAARGGARVARNYVNLLRNAALDTPLTPAAVSDADVSRIRDALIRRAGGAARDRTTLQDAAVERRPELRQIDSGLEASAAAQDLARAAFKPQLALAVDAGIQGEEYGFSDEDRFVLASVVLRFNFFRGGADRAALREARERTSELQAARALAEQQIRLEVLQAVTDFEVAEATLRTTAKRVAAADGAFGIARRKRDLGQIPPVEFIDARRALTSAQLSEQVTRFEALAALAQVEYALGGIPDTGPATERGP